MKNVLVATDLLDQTDIALRRAASIARRFGARMNVVHILDEEQPPAVGEIRDGGVEAVLQDQIAKIDDAKGVETAITTVVGEPCGGTLSAARRVSADFIVIGRHHKGGSSEIFSVATLERLARTATVPILFVNRLGEVPYERAVVGIDFSKCAAKAVSLAAELVGRPGLTIVHAYRLRTTNPSLRAGEKRGRAALDQEKTEQHIRQDLDTWIESCGIGIDGSDVLLLAGSAVTALPLVASQKGADLICLGAHSRSWVSSMIIGSTARELLVHSEFDVLVVPL